MDRSLKDMQTNQNGCVENVSRPRSVSHSRSPYIIRWNEVRNVVLKPCGLKIKPRFVCIQSVVEELTARGSCTGLVTVGPLRYNNYFRSLTIPLLNMGGGRTRFNKTHCACNDYLVLNTEIKSLHTNLPAKISL